MHLGEIGNLLGLSWMAVGQPTPNTGAGAGIDEVFSAKIYNIDSLGGDLVGTNMRVGKWGSSLAVRIPKAIASQWGVSEGSAVEITSVGDHVVLRKQVNNLSDLLSKVTADNLHAEQDIGESRGREQW